MKLEEKRFYFRADGNPVIGAGHLMRCLTIADALSETLGDRECICFLTADAQSAELVRNRFYRTYILQTDYRRMEDEIPILNRFLTGERKGGPAGADRNAACCFLVDSYYMTDRYLQALKQFGQVWILDDLEQHAFPADHVVNYNLFASGEKYEKLYQDRNATCHLGGTYVPVRKQFLGKRYQLRPYVRDVLITTGGSDQERIAEKILAAIWDDACEYHLIIGRFCPDYAEWKERERNRPGLHIYHDVQDMASLMCRCDLAVTAGGSTIYELAAIGVPFVCFSYARNQEALAEYAGSMGLAGYGGAYHKDPAGTLERIAALVRELAENSGRRSVYSERGRKLIDGGGAGRIAGLLADRE